MYRYSEHPGPELSSSLHLGIKTKSRKVEYEHLWKNLFGGEARLIGVGGIGGGRGWPDPEERCTRTPDYSGFDHTPPRGKAKGAGGLEAFIKYVIW